MPSKKVHVIGSEDDVVADVVADRSKVLEQGPEEHHYTSQQRGVNALGRLVKLLVIRRMAEGKDTEIYETLPDGKVHQCAELTRGGIVITKTNTRVTYDNLRDDGRSWAVSHSLETLVSDLEDEAKVIHDLNEAPFVPNPNSTFVVRGVNALGRLFKILALRWIANGGQREIYHQDDDGHPQLQVILTPKGVVIPETGMRFRLSFIRDNGKIPGINTLLEMIVKDAEDNGIQFQERTIPKEHSPQRKMASPKMASVFPDEEVQPESNSNQAFPMEGAAPKGRDK